MCLRILCLVFLAGFVSGQETVPEPAPGQDAPPPITREERSFATLAAIERSREAKTEALRRVRERLTSVPPPPEDERAELLAESRSLQGELDEIRDSYESVATGIDMKVFDQGEPDAFDLEGEVTNLLKPLIEELKGATEAPRQIERLKSQLEYLAGRELLAQEALDSVESLIGALPADDPMSLRRGLEASRDEWKRIIEDYRGQQTVKQFQLDKRESQRTSVLQSTRTALADFFRTRGWNLILALGTFLVVFVGMRSAHRYVSRAMRRKPREERPFYARLVDVLYFLFVGIFALVAALLVLYSTGDWVLLAVTVLFLLGVAWAFKTAIPMFLEQIRLLLNLGTVRERERLLIDGVPYRVSKLSFYTLLSNPDLAGGVRRLPIKDLADMRSRTCSKDEIWFPSRRGDWVLLSDGNRGAVRHQSPDTVQIELLGGSRVTYQTAAYMALAPQNLSVGFRRVVRFGIDYEHQRISTTTVPALLAERLNRGVAAQFGADAVRSLKVEFCEAGASSLDYQVNADIDGSAAVHFDAIYRAIQRICVDTCNEQGWVIPFTQVTVHQAAST